MSNQAIADAAYAAFDISWLKEDARQAVHFVAAEMARPSVLFKPALSRDGSHWCALYGDDLQSGVAGFGTTVDAAMRAFDHAWQNDKAKP